MEHALETGRLEDALSHLDALISTSRLPCEAPHSLRNHSVKDLPTLHFLARIPFKEEDIPHLNKLIKIFSEFGYDINKTTDLSQNVVDNSPGFTALMASVEHQNLVLMECLLRHGARTDICDQGGLSCFHWAVTMGDLKCLEKLVQFGGNAEPASKKSKMCGKGRVCSLLHLAVDFRHTEIVSYLLSKREEFGVDVNEKAVYYEYLPTGGVAGMEIPPMEKAVRMGNILAIQALLEHPDVKLCGLQDAWKSQLGRFYNGWDRTCWKNKPRPSKIVEAFRLLISHGMDVTGMTIDGQFTYHFGYNVILKMMVCAGAKISKEIFTSPKICNRGHPETQGFLQEIVEVKQWKDEFDLKESCSLKHLCRLQVRKMLKCVGDLKQLEDLPGGLKEYVLCKT